MCVEPKQNWLLHTDHPSIGEFVEVEWVDHTNVWYRKNGESFELPVADFIQKAERILAEDGSGQ